MGLVWLQYTPRGERSPVHGTRQYSLGQKAALNARADRGAWGVGRLLGLGNKDKLEKKVNKKRRH
jgi:hypothetical protein